MPDMGQESREVVAPLGAQRNPSAAIVFVCVVFRIPASLLDLIPRFVFERSAQSMFQEGRATFLASIAAAA